MPDAGPQIIGIGEVDDPRLADYTNLKDRQLAAPAEQARDTGGMGLFMAEGELVVRQLVASGLGVKSVLITPTRLETMREVVAGLPDGTPVYVVDLAAMSRIVGFHIHRGVLAAGVRPAARSVRDVLAGARSLVVLEDLANHDNVGGVFRTAAALGGLGNTGVLLSPRCCDPFYRKAIRVSMGMVLRLPFATVEPWPEALEQVRTAGFTLVALTPDPRVAPIEAVGPFDRVALMLGTEGPGLTGGATARADVQVRIPMGAGVDSLNVVVAAGIALHRLAGGHHGGKPNTEHPR